jgi:DNA anti-recombination protein RmuC
MSTTSITQTGGIAAGPGAADAEMDQIRELLVGEQQRHTRARMDRLEARMKELEEDIARRFDALAARIETLGQETAAGRRASFEELSRSVMELGERVRNLSQS